MPKSKQSRGTCAYCGDDYARGGIIRHLAACDAREEAIASAERERDDESETVYHLRTEDAWSSAFWLNLEMRGSATLQELDRYLRAIWLECCGHMSRFGAWGENEVPMEHRADQVFTPDTELTHIYDFGTSSETLVRVMDAREGAPLTEHPLELMARNEMPEIPCMECDRQASWLCVECMYEEDARGTLCDTHAEDHPHDAYGPPLPIVNSPRTGMCAYEGPAEPPY